MPLCKGGEKETEPFSLFFVLLFRATFFFHFSACVSDSERTAEYFSSGVCDCSVCLVRFLSDLDGHTLLELSDYWFSLRFMRTILNSVFIPILHTSFRLRNTKMMYPKIFTCE